MSPTAAAGDVVEPVETAEGADRLADRLRCGPGVARIAGKTTHGLAQSRHRRDVLGLAADRDDAGAGGHAGVDRGEAESGGAAHDDDRLVQKSGLGHPEEPNAGVRACP